LAPNRLLFRLHTGLEENAQQSSAKSALNAKYGGSVKQFAVCQFSTRAFVYKQTNKEERL
jgi:hypothetical protein